eukprot:2480669-Pleurochrysis_carterae.AAC.1
MPSAVSRKPLSMRNPTAPDFSGWNWTALTRPRDTPETYVSPYLHIARRVVGRHIARRVVGRRHVLAHVVAGACAHAQAHTRRRTRAGAQARAWAHEHGLPHRPTLT